MNYLTVDFGSTFTKLTFIDSIREEVISTSAAFTTIETNVMDGFGKALQNLENKIGQFKYDRLLCCSSAAGGLKMVALGLVPELTAKAAKMAASSAGAKVIKTYSFEISKREQDEIYQINPDLVLLCGGTDGGNKEVIIANAIRLSQIERDFSIIVAGNKSASYQIEEIFSKSGKDFVITDNVMPYFNNLVIEPAKSSIKDLFIRKIVEAKGLSTIQNMTDYKIIPTPLAVMYGCELLSKGTSKNPGIGDLMAIDIGGATTDVYSMSKGNPSVSNVMIKGIPEPYSKRSVEGDLGMRYSLSSVCEQVDIEILSIKYGIDIKIIKDWIELCINNPDTISQNGSIQERVEAIIAREAISIAVQRHAGVMESIFTPMGEIYTLTGKDLTQVESVIGIGGAIKNSSDPTFILEGAKFDLSNITSTKPKNPCYMIDEKYIFASMGLLSTVDKDLAFKILKKEIKQIN